MEVLLRSLYAVTPLRISLTRDNTAEVLNMLKVSAVPPRRSAVLTVFGGATAINDGITAEPWRSWRCHCGLCRTTTAVAPRLRCDGGSTAEARRNMLKVSAVPPRRSAVLTVFGGATAINDGTTAELRRSWRCYCGFCRTSTAVAPRIRCDGGNRGLTNNANIISDLLGRSLSGFTIPPEVLVTSGRPDLVIHYSDTNVIKIIQLTVPFETSIEKEHTFKTNK